MTEKAPTTAKEAALKIVMGEVASLLTEAEDITKTLDAVHKELHTDLFNLGRLVERAETMNKESKEDIKSLAKYIDTKFTTNSTQAKPTIAPQNAQKTNYWLPTIASALIASCIVGAGLYFASGELVHKANIGESLQKAWPKLDKATQDKLNAAFAK